MVAQCLLSQPAPIIKEDNTDEEEDDEIEDKRVEEVANLAKVGFARHRQSQIRAFWYREIGKNDYE